MGRFGDSYQYFASQTIDKSPSQWRAANPNGEPETWFQANTTFGMAAWKPAPLLTKVPADPTFKQTHPNGLTESELQAMSSEASAWHSSPAGGALTQTAVAQGVSKDTLAARVQQFFHPTKSDVQAQ